MKNLETIPKGHTIWQLREKDFPKIILTDVCEIHIIELRKLMDLMRNKKTSKQENNLLQWTKFLLTPKELGVNDMKDNEALKKAKEEFDEIQKDEHERYLAGLRMKHILDTESIREGGFEDGIKKGKEKKQKEIAIEMLKNNETTEKIMKYTGLTQEEIEQLKQYFKDDKFKK